MMKPKSIYRNLIVIISLSSSLALPSCKKFIELDPPVTSVNEGNVYTEDANAAAALTGIYAKMANQSFSLNLSVLPELSADNLAIYTTSNPNFANYYANNLQGNDPSAVTKLWINMYPFVFNVNAAIEALNKSTTLTSAVRQNLLGEAYFLRGFYYFYLANLYGDVPLALSTDYSVNNSLARSPVAQVYAQVVTDLKQAQSLLTDNFLQGDAITAYPANSEERVRPNKSAATAMLARTYLNMKEWANAEQAASEVISKNNQFSIIPLDQVFLKNSQETIWSLQAVKGNLNTDEGDLFTLRDGGPNNGSQIIYLSNDFYDAFQLGDQRKTKWTGTQSVGIVPYRYASKYKAILGASSITEYTICLRFAEQYLIRAEARIQLDKIADGISDLNVIRDRAIDKGEPDPDKRLKLLETTLSKDEALTALMYERRVEFFCEWGHRWSDLKRSGKIDAVMTPATQSKGGTWQAYKALYPVPTTEIVINRKLNQNTGYTN